MSDFASRLRFLIGREKRYAVARKAGISPGYLSGILNGHKASISLRTLEAILTALGKTLTDYDRAGRQDRRAS